MNRKLLINGQKVEFDPETIDGLFLPDTRGMAPPLTQYENEKVFSKLNKRKYDWGRGQMVVSFLCEKVRALDSDLSGKLFAIPENKIGDPGTFHVVGRILHVFRNRSIVVILIDRQYHAWVRERLAIKAGGEKVPNSEPTSRLDTPPEVGS